MLLNQCLSGLKFDDHAFIDPQISVVLPNNLTFIINTDRLLLFDSQFQFFQFYSKCVFINLFQKAGTKSVVDFVSTADDLLRNVIGPS